MQEMCSLEQAARCPRFMGSKWENETKRSPHFYLQMEKNKKKKKIKFPENVKEKKMRNKFCVTVGPTDPGGQKNQSIKLRVRKSDVIRSTVDPRPFVLFSSFF